MPAMRSCIDQKAMCQTPCHGKNDHSRSEIFIFRGNVSDLCADSTADKDPRHGITLILLRDAFLLEFYHSMLLPHKRQLS